jgi:hypothetical protein
MDLADQIAIGRVAAHAVFARVAVPHAAPQIAVHVGSHAVGRPGGKIGRKDLAVRKLVTVDVEDADVGLARPRCDAVDHIELFLVG